MALLYKVDYQTPYYQRLIQWLKTVGQGSGIVSQSELLELMNAKPTKSFYRAVNQAIVDGYAKKIGITGKNGGRAIAYEVPQKLRQMALEESEGLPF